MLTKLTPSTIRGLSSLIRMDQWRSVEAALSNELQATYERMMVTVDAPTLHELRGRARILSDILKLCQRDKLDSLEYGARRRT